ncbi:MAG TPA: amidohydrolase [Candidatus Dormibacteraeota bacterium]|nr:amidohydrolase [Candidatus Dormibacteraeota bacterium]
MKADLILAGGVIRTLGRAGLRPFSHLAVRGGLVVAVGGADVLGLKGASTRVLDLAGGAVLPGFNDPHAHVVYHALSSYGADLTGSRSIAELQGRLRRSAERLPEGAWLLGRGYSSLELAEGRAPHRAELDAVTGDRPCFVDDRGGHSRVANSAALTAAGLGPRSPDPPGGSLGREPDGSLDGRLLEAAMRMVADHQPAPPFEQRWLGVQRTLRLLASRGITSVGAAVNRGFADDHRVYAKLAEKGRLRVRVNEFLSWELLPALGRLGLGSGGAGSLVRFGPVKVFVDGGASSGSAAFRGRGVNWRTPPAELAELVREANAAGLQVAAHCIGDAAVEAMVRAVELAQAEYPRRLRHRVEHCTHCPTDLQRRLSAAGMVAVMQPLFASLGRARLAAELGNGSERHLAAHRDLERAGVRVAFSSDLPVTPEPNPWHGLAAAVTDPLQPLTPLKALRAYTFEGAWTSYEERIKGTLEEGRAADFQVYGVDPLAQPPKSWPALRPRLVALAGRPVWGSF